MNPRLAKWLLHSYPLEWRAQYGQELEDLLRQRNLRISDIVDVLWNGFVQRMRKRFFAFSFCLLGGSALTFITCLMFANSLWRTLTAPMSGILRQQGVRPSALIQVTPFEVLGVVWLGIPMLVTVFITFVLMLILVSLFFNDSKETSRRRLVTQFVASSGTVFAVCSILSFLALRDAPLPS